MGVALQGEYLLQGAAGSTLGKMLIQYCRTKGIKTINIVRRQAQVQELKDLGSPPPPPPPPPRSRPPLYTTFPRHERDITCSARPRPIAQSPGCLSCTQSMLAFVSCNIVL